MTMNVRIVGYRDWAKECARLVQEEIARIYPAVEVSFKTYIPTALLDPDLIFLVGWSEMVEEHLYAHRTVIVLHPSPLPRYRGGSPIQHQIIEGETVSAVTLFKLDKDYPGIDSGPICWQMPFSLEGSLQDILGRIAKVGAMGIVTCIRAAMDKELHFVPQAGAPMARKRRTPEMSEITEGDIRVDSALKLHNKIRALQHPYPLPFVTAGDNRRLYILSSRAETEEDYEKRMKEETPFPVDPYFVQPSRCSVCGGSLIGQPLGCPKHGFQPVAELKEFVRCPVCGVEKDIHFHTIREGGIDSKHQYGGPKPVEDDSVGDLI